MVRCTICEKSFTLINYHHTVPRSRGGENSRQIPLCPTCHDILHANAVAVVAKIRNPKYKNNTIFWKTYIEEQNADEFLQILVSALLQPIPEGLTREHELSIAVQTELFEQFKLLQMDLGFSSQQKTLEYCLHNALESRGLLDVKRSKEKELSDLWFLFGSNKG